MESIEEYAMFMHEKKSLVGMSDWTVFVSDEFKDMDEEATVVVNIYDKTLKVDLSTKFEGFDERRKKNVLMHELVHAKIAAYNEEIRELINAREEHLVNDLTKGYEDLL